MYTQENILEFSPYILDPRVSTEYFRIKLPFFTFKIVHELAFAIFSSLNRPVTFIKSGWDYKETFFKYRILIEKYCPIL